MTWSQRLLGAFFVAAGTLHLARPNMYEQIMPDYIPAHREIVLASGIAEIAGGAGLASTSARRAAGLWLTALLVAIFPANIHMALHPERYRRFPRPLLWARLPLQPLLVAWVLHASRGQS